MAKSLSFDCSATFASAHEDLFKTRFHSDVTFLLGPQKVPSSAHRLILAMHSDVMDRMLYGSMLEGKKSKIELPKADEVAFEALLRYFYTGKTEIDPNKITELVKLCDYYNVASLKEKCSRWLQSNLNPDNVGLYMDFAKLYDDKLHRLCHIIAAIEASKVLGSKAFAKFLSGEQALSILRSNDLQIDEYEVFEAVSRWAEHHRDSSYVKKLIENVRFGLIPSAYLVDRVQESGLVDSKVILSALTHQHHPKNSVLQLPSPLFARKRQILLAFDQSLKKGCSVSEGKAYLFSAAALVGISRKNVQTFLGIRNCKIQFSVRNFSYRHELYYSTGTLSVYFKPESKSASDFRFCCQTRGNVGSNVSVYVSRQTLGSYSCSSQFSFLVSASGNETIDLEFPDFSLTVKGEDYGCPKKLLSERGDLYLELTDIDESASIECSVRYFAN
ncbi:BTB/POZ domain-containing protein 9-like [Oscarella lobularis]|uniref:BTB/POZ domain-containing protein 9-like n=1 Tax=Oscarella lobularis TaxID=121494 RepID=UPI0033134243